MTRLTLLWSDAEYWIPASWCRWCIDGVNFKRVDGRIYIEHAPNAWISMSDHLVDDGFAMPRSA